MSPCEDTTSPLLAGSPPPHAAALPRGCCRAEGSTRPRKYWRKYSLRLFFFFFSSLWMFEGSSKGFLFFKEFNSLRFVMLSLPILISWQNKGRLVEPLPCLPLPLPTHQGWCRKAFRNNETPLSFSRVTGEVMGAQGWHFGCWEQDSPQRLFPCQASTGRARM